MLNEFTLLNWPVRKDRIVSPRANDAVGNTNNVIYSIPKNMIEYYMQRLKACAIKCFNDGNNNTFGVENSLFDHFNPEVHEFLSIPAYIGGMCAVQYRVWLSC